MWTTMRTLVFIRELLTVILLTLILGYAIWAVCTIAPAPWKKPVQAPAMKAATDGEPGDVRLAP